MEAAGASFKLALTTWFQSAGGIFMSQSYSWSGAQAREFRNLAYQAIVD